MNYTPKPSTRQAEGAERSNQIKAAATFAALIDQPQSPEAQLRQALPAVLEMAERHGIDLCLAREFYEERGS